MLKPVPHKVSQPFLRVFRSTFTDQRSILLRTCLSAAGETGKMSPSWISLVRDALNLSSILGSESRMLSLSGLVVLELSVIVEEQRDGFAKVVVVLLFSEWFVPLSRSGGVESQIPVSQLFYLCSFISVAARWGVFPLSDVWSGPFLSLTFISGSKTIISESKTKND